MPPSPAREPAGCLTSVAESRRRDQLSYLLFLSVGIWGGIFIIVVVSRLASGEGIRAWMLAAHLLSAGFGLLLTPLCWLLVRELRRFQIWVRVTLLATAVLALAGLHAFANALLWTWLLGASGHEAPPAIFTGAVATGLFRYFLVYALILTGLGLLRALMDRDAREAELAQARAAAQQAKIAALRFQLNPHFLFNTLNAISSLIVTGRAPEAERMIEKLADFMRTSLTSDPTLEVSLEEELEVAEAYLSIEEVRFPSRLLYEVDCPPRLLRAAVPSFLLQPLVENAVKYAVAPSSHPVTVRIAGAANEERLVLTVSDDAKTDQAQASGGSSGTGIGLTNTRSRLAALFGSAATVDAAASGSGFAVTVTLPLRITDHEAGTGSMNERAFPV